MYIVHVDIHVKPEYVEAFQAATVENARNSIQEPGITRFDLIQNNDDITNFVLVEVYRTPADADMHKQTAHYLKWRAIAAEMMATERTSVKYTNIFPDDSSWA